jgi:acetyltransferase-like isoleucine patch superfamily enzyme
MSANPIGGDDRTIFSLKNNAILMIGEETGISNTAIVCHENVSIGDRVRIGGGTKIYDTDFHSLSYEERKDYLTETAKSKPIRIDDDVFIGAHCIILKGVQIGKRSIVGAGSVVTKTIPEDEVWAGNPARFIRKIQ